jgi:hypothetical protein
LGEKVNPEFWKQFSEELQDEQFRQQFFAALLIDLMKNNETETVHKTT